MEKQWKAGCDRQCGYSHPGFALSTHIGEFGVVYRAKLLRKQGRSEPEFVAVKTMRGMLQLGNK